MPGSDTGVMPPGMQSPPAFPFFAAPPLTAPQTGLPGGVAPALKGGKQSGRGGRFLVRGN